MAPAFTRPPAVLLDGDAHGAAAPAGATPTNRAGTWLFARCGTAAMWLQNHQRQLLLPTLYVAALAGAIWWRWSVYSHSPLVKLAGVALPVGKSFAAVTQVSG